MHDRGEQGVPCPLFFGVSVKENKELSLGAVFVLAREIYRNDSKAPEKRGN